MVVRSRFPRRAHSMLLLPSTSQLIDARWFNSRMSFDALGVVVMISGPGDTAAEVEVVRQAISSWNNDHSQDMGVVFIIKHYSTDVVPVYVKGADGQSVINDQVTNESDIVIALFKERLGTPTLRNNYSGTVEEADLREPDSPVHFYFWRSDVAPAALLNDGPERDQWLRLNEFRAKFHENTSELYNSFDSSADLDEKVKKALWKDAREFAASRTSPAMPPTAPAQPDISLSVTVAGSVWHFPQAERVIENFISIDVEQESRWAEENHSPTPSFSVQSALANSSLYGRPRRRPKKPEQIEEWTAEVRNHLNDFDESIAVAAAPPIEVSISSDGLIEGLEIEFTFENVMGLDMEEKSWADIWTPLYVPPKPETLIGYRDWSIPSPDLRSLGANRSSWERTDTDAVILTVYLDEVRKRSKPDVFEDAVILAVPYAITASTEIRYSWHATARNPNIEWSGTGTVQVIDEKTALEVVAKWMKPADKD